MATYRPRRKHKVEYIVIHYTASPNVSRDIMYRYIMSARCIVSTHYIVDDTGYTECFHPDRYICHHVGTGGSGVTNANSVGIDICEKKQDTSTKSVKDRDWHFSEESLEHAATLCAELLRRYNLPLEAIKRHYDVTGKVCPRPFVGEDINTATGRTHDDAWESFLLLVDAYRKENRA